MLKKEIQGANALICTYFNADTEDTVGKEDLLALEDKVMRELDGVNEQLDNLHNILKAIKKK